MKKACKAADIAKITLHFCHCLKCKVKEKKKEKDFGSYN